MATTTFLLPPDAYYSRKWWEHEQRALFGRSYNLVAYASDLQKAGDRVVTQVGGPTIVVERQADGDIVAFVRGPDGTGLRPAAVGRWAGMIFAHPGPGAPRFEEWLGEFVQPDKGGDFDWDRLVEVDRIIVPLRCNWKLYIENHVDIYHLWYLHDESLGMYDHLSLEWWEAGRHWGCVESLRPGSVRQRPGMRPIQALADSERTLLRANLIFPNVPMTTMCTSVVTYQVVPTGPETCYLDLRVRGEAGSAVEDRSAFLRVQRDEDGGACEEIQRGVRSPWFSVGPIAQVHELPIQRFHEHLLAHLGPA